MVLLVGSAHPSAPPFRRGAKHAATAFPNVMLEKTKPAPGRNHDHGQCSSPVVCPSPQPAPGDSLGCWYEIYLARSQTELVIPSPRRFPGGRGRCGKSQFV